MCQALLLLLLLLQCYWEVKKVANSTSFLSLILVATCSISCEQPCSHEK